MIKGIDALVLLTMGLFATEQTDRDTDIVYWHEQKLSWDDFQGAVPTNSEHAATTFSSFILNWKHIGDTLKCTISTEFNKGLSWKKPESAKPHLLSHEQRHFDITEYISRCCRKGFLEYKFKSFNTAISEADSLVGVYDNKFDQWQGLYDEETNHSKNKEAQSKWDEKVDSLLLSMEEYSNPIVNLYIGYLYD